MTEVAVIIVGYRALPYIDECLQSLRGTNTSNINLHVVLVDNKSPEKLAEHVKTNYPWVALVQAESNGGFTGGNNLGWSYVQEQYPNTEYIFLLNQDTLVDPDFLSAGIDALKTHPEAAAAQSRLMLHPQTHQINSAGNCSQYLGFGFVRGYGSGHVDKFDRIEPIAYPSGAAVLIRTDDIRRLGLFEEAMFLYLEDADLGWKLRQVGRDVLYVPDSVVFHKFTFDSTLKAYYYLERNRWWLLAVYYKWPTMLLLLPAISIMEAAQFGFACMKGIPAQKLRAMAWFLKPANRRLICALRKQAQDRRTVSDADFLKMHTGSIDAPMLRSFVLDYLMNPLLSLYWRAVRPLIRW